MINSQSKVSKESSNFKFSDRKNSFLKDTSQPASGPPNSVVTTFTEDRITIDGVDDSTPLRLVKRSSSHE